MKARIHTSLATLTAALLLGSLPAHAWVSGIGTSTASTEFEDKFSFSPPPGATYSVAGTPNTTFFQIDSTTFDLAQGDFVAAFVPLTDTYSVALNNVMLTQATSNTGMATLMFQFSIDFQLDILGLGPQGALAPTFNVFGTVQTTFGSFASVTGFIDYYNPTGGAIGSPIASVTYNSIWNTPGTFTGTAAPSVANTPALAGFTDLLLVGNILFTVDPASINAQTIPVPEPAAGLLALMSLPALLARRRARRA